MENSLSDIPGSKYFCDNLVISEKYYFEINRRLNSLLQYDVF